MRQTNHLGIMPETALLPRMVSLLTHYQRQTLWKYTITRICITNQKNGKNIYWNS